MADPPPYWTVQGACVQVALNAFHVPLSSTSIELPWVGCVKYADFLPLRLPEGPMRTYPGGVETRWVWVLEPVWPLVWLVDWVWTVGS